MEINKTTHNSSLTVLNRVYLIDFPSYYFNSLLKLFYVDVDCKTGTRNQDSKQSLIELRRLRVFPDQFVIFINKEQNVH